MTQWLMAYGVERRRSSSTPPPIPAQAHDSLDLGNSVGVAGILKAKKGNSEARQREFETNYKSSFLLEIVPSRGKNIRNLTSGYRLTVFVLSNECKWGFASARLRSQARSVLLYTNHVFLY